MPQDKQFPVKILEDLYIHGIIGANKDKKEEFLKLNFFEKMELLVLTEPLVRKVRISGINSEFYVSTFGDFIVSPSEKLFGKWENKEISQGASEQYFLNLKTKSEKMDSYFDQMKKFVNAGREH